MFDTVTSKARPTAASHAANTINITGIILDSVNDVFSMVTVLRINNDNIMPSRHSRDDIRWDRYIKSPSRAIVNASRMFM